MVCVIALGKYDRANLPSYVVAVIRLEGRISNNPTPLHYP